MLLSTSYEHVVKVLGRLGEWDRILGGAGPESGLSIGWRLLTAGAGAWHPLGPGQGSRSGPNGRGGEGFGAPSQAVRNGRGPAERGGEEGTRFLREL